jgi:hypothetical protein
MKKIDGISNSKKLFCGGKIWDKTIIVDAFGGPYIPRLLLKV